MKQILCLSHTPWQARPNRTQQLLTRLTDAQILFIEPAPPKGAQAPEQGRRMRPHIAVYTLPVPLPDPKDPPVLQRRRFARMTDFLQSVMARHRFLEPVLWCTAPAQAAFLDKLAYRGVVYDCHRLWSDLYLEQESDLACHAEVVFAASNALAKRLSPCNVNVALLPNGVNDRMFSRDDLAVPPALAALEGHPILGRVGDLDSRVDLEPLTFVAGRRLEWSFVLMGRYTKPVQRALAPYRNVILAGPVSAVDVPDWLSGCDILFDLFRQDRKGWGVLPAAVYEYLATGKPVLRLIEPEGEEHYPELIYHAYDGKGFLRRCRQAMEEAPALPERRRACAREASWANRAAQVAAILDATGLF